MSDGENMKLYKKICVPALVFVSLLVMCGCNNASTKIDLGKIETDNVIKFHICDSTKSYLFICTKDFEVVTYDKLTEEIKISECTEKQKSFIRVFLNYIKENEQYDIDSEFSVNDFLQVRFYLDNKEYSFVYGTSPNPYVNMLIEQIIGCCDKDIQEELVPYPASLRQ